jgi:hypothetical protein
MFIIDQITPTATVQHAAPQSRVCAKSTAAPAEFAVQSAHWKNVQRDIAAAAGEVVEFP